MPEPFIGVACHYANFEQTPDEQVIDLLASAHARLPCDQRSGELCDRSWRRLVWKRGFTGLTGQVRHPWLYRVAWYALGLQAERV